MKQRISSGLVTLSSAAILSVYGAGYARTREASDRFDAEDQRRPPLPIPAMAPTPVAPSSTAGLEGDGANQAPAFALPTRPATALDRPVAATTVNDGPSAPAPSPTTTRTSHVEAPATVDAKTTAAPTAALAIATAAAASVANSPAPAGAPSTAVATAQPAPEAAAPVAAAAVLKDGSYLGWGHCRHGDIQAAVTIEGGRISDARIATCLTRYSCSWISPLPPQVVARQTPETDYVSGATDSTNAFYYAVIDALSKAK
jgi:uncharacterized protein with FMN-binding domain